MERIERKWPGEQPWWFFAASSDQLTAFKRKKLSRCKKDSNNPLPNHKVGPPLISNGAAWLFFHLDYSAGQTSVLIHLDDCTDRYLAGVYLRRGLYESPDCLPKYQKVKSAPKTCTAISEIWISLCLPRPQSPNEGRYFKTFKKQHKENIHHRTGRNTHFFICVFLNRRQNNSGTRHTVFWVMDVTHFPSTGGTCCPPSLFLRLHLHI